MPTPRADETCSTPRDDARSGTQLALFQQYVTLVAAAVLSCVRPGLCGPLGFGAMRLGGDDATAHRVVLIRPFDRRAFRGPAPATQGPAGDVRPLPGGPSDADGPPLVRPGPLRCLFRPRPARDQVGRYHPGPG